MSGWHKLGNLIYWLVRVALCGAFICGMGALIVFAVFLFLGLTQ